MMKSKKASIVTDNLGKIILVMAVLVILLIIIWTQIKPRLGSQALSFLPGM